MNRDELVEVGARAMLGGLVGVRTMAAAVIDATEPLIRVDEAKRMNERWRTQVLDNERARMRLDMMSDFRAKVEALQAVPSTYDGMSIKVDPATMQGVLALIDGSGKSDHPEATRSGKALADLRAKVESLATWGAVGVRDGRTQLWVDRSDVLALIDGSDDG